VNLAVILDVSGSMAGKKLDNCKLAIKSVIHNLSIHDKFHLITYDTKAQVELADANLRNKPGLDVAIDSLKSGSNTNLYAGLELGFETVKKYHTDGSNSRIFIFSDGVVNEGVTDNAKIFELIKKYQQESINTTSFGIGEGFNTALMHGLAEHGKGLFFFLDTPDNVVSLVNKAFEGIIKLIGASAVLKIRGEKGAIVKRVYGHPDLIKGASLGDLIENDVINIVAEAEVTPHSDADRQNILRYELKYTNVSPNTSNNVDVFVRGIVAISVTEYEDKVEREDPEVLASLVLAESAEKEREIAAQITIGKLPEAIALKEQIIARFKEVLKVEGADLSGMLKLALQQAETVLEKLKAKNVDRQLMVQEACYNGYKHGHQRRYGYEPLS